MKAITILEPWASLIAYGKKKIETRSWATKYRGKLAIHAGKGTRFLELGFKEPFLSALAPHYRVSDTAKYGLAFNGGYVIAIADLVDCQRVVGKSSLKVGDQKQVIAVLENQMRITGNEFTFGDYDIGRYAWILDNVRQIEPVPAKGMQRLWKWEGA